MDEEGKKQPPGFYVYNESALALSLMSREEAGAVIQACSLYHLERQTTALNGNAERVFRMMKGKIDEGYANYQITCERNRKNGSQGGRPKKKK